MKNLYSLLIKMNTHPHSAHAAAAKPDHKKHGFSLFKLVLGAAVATGAGIYYATHKDQIDKAAIKKIDELAKMLYESKAVVEKKVEKAWGKVSRDAVQKYGEIRNTILENLQAENLEKHGAILKQRYEQIVEKVIKSAKKSGILTPDVEKKLEQLYKLDWNDIKKVMDTVFVEAKKAVGNVNKTVAKTISKKAPVKKAAAKKAAGTASKKPAVKKPAVIKTPVKAVRRR
jgi:hypothetical protein